jgi:hypothetical protein
MDFRWALTGLTPSVAAAVLASSILTFYTIWVCPRHRRRRIRAKVSLFESSQTFLCSAHNEQLPPNLQAWRLPGNKKAEEQIWNGLDPVFREAGFTLWLYEGFNFLRAPNDTNSSMTGFGYTVPFRSDPKAVGGLRKLRIFEYAVSGI